MDKRRVTVEDRVIGHNYSFDRETHRIIGEVKQAFNLPSESSALRFIVRAFADEVTISRKTNATSTRENNNADRKAH